MNDGMPTPTVTSIPAGARLSLFQGRIGRLGYFLGGLYILIAVVLLFFALFFIDAVLGTAHIPNMLAVIINVVIFLASIGLLICTVVWSFSLGVRRLHDLEQPGLLILLMLIPLGNLFMTFYLLLAPGTVGPNRYGTQASRLDPLSVLGFASL